MNKKELTLTKENTLSFALNQDIKTNNNIQNNYNQKEFSQIFNKIYDSNFLVIINELSSQIQSFYKSSNTQFNIIKPFFSNNEDKQLSEIHKSINTIEILISQFYSIAKVLFKKMKIYRNEKMKTIYQLSSTRIHKRSQTILLDKEKNKIPFLLNLDNIKDNNNIKNNLISTNGGCDSERSQKIKKILNIDKINDSNVNINYNNSNNFSQSLNTTIDKDSNIILIEDKNQYSNLLIEYSDNLFKDIQSLEDTILSKGIVNKDDDKIINIINSIKKIGNSIKDNISIYNLSNDNHDKKIVNDLSNKINLLSEENITIKKRFEKYKNEEKIKRKFFENQILNLSNKISDYEKTKKNTDNKLKEMKNKFEEELNTKNKEILSLQKIINDYKDKTKNKINLIAENIQKGSEGTNDDIHKIKKLNDKYNNVVTDLEKENKEINDLLIQCENEKKNNIDILNKELENKNELIQEYKNKYENEIKKNNILESKLKDINNINEDDGNMTEYETKKIRKKIPIPTKRNNIDDNNELKEEEKKFKSLYKTMNNFYKNKSRNILSSLYNSNNTSKSSMTNDIKLSNNYNMNSSMKKTDILNYSNQKEKINNSYNNEESGRNIENIDNKISPDNYSIVKVYQLNNKLKWILFRKNKKINEMKYIRYSLGNNSKDKYDYNYNDYIWMPYRTDNDFNEFGDISLFIEKEKEYNNIIIKLNQKNKAYENYIEKLKIENYSLNNIISKHKSEIKEDKNLIGISFIEDDPESSKFIDDKCCEDILKGLDKNKENMKNKTSCYNINLKNSIDMLMTKVIPSENVRSLISSILRQLGCSDEDIYRLIGYHRGAISIPFSINKQGVK